MRNGKRLRRAALLAAAACLLGPGGGLARAGEIVENEKSLYSFANEEVIVRDFFNDRRGGVFLDVGAFHYKMVSTTYYLEEQLGWSGIAVDALAEFALDYIEHRPNTRFFNFLVTDHSYTVEPFYRVPGAHKGLSTTDRSWLQSWLHRFGREFPDAREAVDQRQTVFIMTITLNDLLKANGVTKVDFVSMNIEGGEMKALAGFDLERYRPDFLCIECLGRKKALIQYFRQHGYVIASEYNAYAHDKNCYFKRAR